MRVLVTAGNTQVPIDRVRCITNVFTGRTGARLALHAGERGHAVTLLTSHPEVIPDLSGGAEPPPERWAVHKYVTFDDLRRLLAAAIPGGLDVIVHCAAVSDYLIAGVYAAAPDTRFRPEDGRWAAEHGAPTLLDRAAGKVKSDEPELWLRLVRAPKLIDLMRADWGFRGILVKFKLEVDVDDERLLDIAERSRVQSGADLMVANALEGADSWAFLGPVAEQYERVARAEMPQRLFDVIERLRRERPHG